ncbi:MAG: hypothetical protein RLW62_08910, partial [Gammaproteobacteria bacterium]
MSWRLSRLLARRARPAPDVDVDAVAAAGAAGVAPVAPPRPDDGDGAAGVLLDGFGLRRSRAERRPVDAAGAPLPWYTFPAIEFLEQIDWREKRVFEYGAGHSSYFWAARAAEVVTVEQEPRWFAEIARTPHANLTLLNEPCAERFPHVIREHGEFDVIVDDAAQRL